MPAGLSRNPEANLSQMLRSRIDAGDFPSAVYVVAENGKAIFADALGDAVRAPEMHAATLETIYDLASLTKPLVTGLLCARLVESGRLTLDSSVAQYLQEFDRADKHQITVRELLTHTSGLPAWRPLYLTAGDKEGALAAMANEKLVYKTGKRVAYSDLGFIVLGFLLQRLTGAPFDQLAQRDIIDPLKLRRTFFNPARELRTDIAASETGNAYELAMCEGDLSSTAPESKSWAWRKQIIWGEVHDGNAYFLGGAAGHAGLFSTASETLRLANQFIAARSELLSKETCDLFRQNMTKGLNEARSFAWQLAATKDSTAGPALSRDAFGHNGFTGTSCWIDAERQRVFVLLTNRTHDHPLPFININATRRQFHTLAVSALGNL
ncbi:MAG TPA: serine hydrolase domain-containing protein [Pyrinomonadaceae bacterium]|nr:serine hydrolase domain-containing protein [Pyrinomonadaceae bacterium]